MMMPRLRCFRALLLAFMLSVLTAAETVSATPVLPPNTGMTLVAEVAGTTRANDAFWAVQCKKIPSNTLFLVLDMGAVRDFFKPIAGASYCEMLQSNTKHQWRSDGVVWTTPEFCGGSNGGSAIDWPLKKGRDGDARQYLSFWGTDDDRQTGGCCSTSTTEYNRGWGKACTYTR